MDIDDQLKMPCRLIIKNIPENISDEHFYNLLNDNFSKQIKEQPLIIKLSKKYATKKKNKICIFTVESLDARAKITEFVASFELIDPKGMKQKLIVNDCLLQTGIKSNKDEIENSMEDCEHFLKFKEAFASEKIVDFKTKEEEYSKELFEGIEESTSLLKGKEEDVTTIASVSSTLTTKQKGKMVIMKKGNEGTPIKVQRMIINDKQEGDQQQQQQIEEAATETSLPTTSQDSTCEIEIIQESSSSNKHYKNNNRGQKNKGGYNDKYYNDNSNYYNNDGYYYGNNNGGGNKKGYLKNNNNTNINNNNNGGGYYDNGYYYENGGNGGGSNSNKQAYRKGGYKKGYK